MLARLWFLNSWDNCSTILLGQLFYKKSGVEGLSLA